VNVVLGSAFRNAAGKQIERWANQCDSLDKGLRLLDFGFKMVAIEGDSTDSTRKELDALTYFLPLSVYTCNHGGPVFGSTEHSDRLTALSKVGNAILDHSTERDCDVLVYVESDLIWTPETIISLISKVSQGYDIIAPLIFAGDLFYDIFVYRGLDGERFSPFYPYHESIGKNTLLYKKEKDTVLVSRLVEVQSAGSCLVMRAEIARKCRIRNDMALLGFCQDVREKGYHIFVDPSQRIQHP
jgi:hypothetical protein